MKLATLLYIKNRNGEYLLMERAKEPNKGLMSPPGGKLIQEEAESPLKCAVREFFEECSIETNDNDWILKGIVTEKNYPSIGNIMIFLMELRNFVNELPEKCNEGAFYFIHPDDFRNYEIPITDKLYLWKNILANKADPFILTLDCTDYPDIKQLFF